MTFILVIKSWCKYWDINNISVSYFSHIFHSNCIRAIIQGGIQNNVLIYIWINTISKNDIFPTCRYLASDKKAVLKPETCHCWLILPVWNYIFSFQIVFFSSLWRVWRRKTPGDFLYMSYENNMLWFLRNNNIYLKC